MELQSSLQTVNTPMNTPIDPKNRSAGLTKAVQMLL